VNPRVLEGLRYLGRELSATRAEFHSANGPGAAMLLDGLIGNGFAIQKRGRLALSERGRHALGSSTADAQG
jgi:hypothetical protein